MIFSPKALIYTVVGGGLGYLIYLLISMFIANNIFIGIGIAAFFALIGFLVGTFKIPESQSFEVTKKAGGLNIDEVILKYIKFKQKKNRIFLYIKEGKK